jgi:hypothetical protein
MLVSHSRETLDKVKILKNQKMLKKKKLVMAAAMMMMMDKMKVDNLML